MLVVPRAQRGQVRGDLARPDRGEVGDPRRGEHGQVAIKITTVRAERVRRQATLDRQVVKIGSQYPP
ncbi:hypothetical protein Pme01_27590 [Planosporangium mesophilum]|uniref:Uncharacterized protein n=1 Tax=Planosporangium mesophilum TaxID=689768 RepID=A0A8J3TC44_9ACTN|nr:hypothetical protein Pme01_27590 [Planosporangium mesophilum]